MQRPNPWVALYLKNPPTANLTHSLRDERIWLHGHLGQRRSHLGLSLPWDECSRTMERSFLVQPRSR